MKTSLALALTALLLLTACGGSEASSDATAIPTSASGASTAPPTGEVTGDYFVGTTDCDDGGDGTDSAPFCTIQHGVEQLEPGQALTILAGSYAERVNVTRSGQPGAPILIQGVATDQVIVDGGYPSFPCTDTEFPGATVFDGFRVVDQQHVIIRSLTLNNVPQHGISGINTVGLIIEDIVTNGTGESGINVYDSSALTVRRNRVTRANLGNTQDGETTYLEEAISIVNTSDFEIAFNHLHDNLKEGIDPKVGSRSGIIHDNLIERQCSVGIYVNEAHDLDIYQNEIVDIGWFRVGDQTAPCGEIVEPIVDGGDSILLAVGDLYGEGDGTMSGISIHHNILRSPRYACIRTWDQFREVGEGHGSIRGIQIFNNVMFDCGTAGWGPAVVLDHVLEVEIRNNIFMRTRQGAIDAFGDSDDPPLFSHNLFFDADPTVGDNNIEGDPMFVDPANGDFHLSPGSPAIDAGTQVGFPSAGTAPDLGAFEVE